MVRCIEWMHKNDKIVERSRVAFNDLVLQCVEPTNEELLDRLLALDDVPLSVEFVRKLVAQVMVNSSLLPLADRLLDAYLRHGETADVVEDISLLCVDAARCGDAARVTKLYSLISETAVFDRVLEVAAAHQRTDVIDAMKTHCSVTLGAFELGDKWQHDDEASVSIDAVLSSVLSSMNKLTGEAQRAIDITYDVLEVLCRRNDVPALLNFFEQRPMGLMQHELTSDSHARGSQLLQSLIDSDVSLFCIQLLYENVSMRVEHRPSNVSLTNLLLGIAKICRAVQRYCHQSDTGRSL
jgi:hypothetical protein